MILDEKIELFFHIFKIIINDLSPRRTSITWTLHFAIPLLLEIQDIMFRFVRTAPLFRPRYPLPNSPLGKRFARIPTCSEFRTEDCKKNFIHFSVLIRTMNQCPWLWETLLLSSLFFVFHTKFSVFPEQKIRLSSLI